ncbi:MAG: DUF4430 domain-containing protein [Actinobacteria bacterium]|nr:DUF4430 domain-containing protein [Actinomycetota bacterium]
MFRRSLVLAGAVALVLAAAASAAQVKVRVEGKTRTIFAPTELTVSADNALGALATAAGAGEFYYHVTETAFGPYVDQIGLFPSGGVTGWVYKVNGVSPPVGADQYVVKPGDKVLWYFATFGPTGGPPTLELERAAQSCYRVYSVDDAGTRAPAVGAVLHVGSKRTVATQGATQTVLGCVGKHRGLLVRATLDGAVRSNALP